MSNFSDALQNVQTIYDADIGELSAVNAANEPIRASLEAAQAQLEQNKLALDAMSAELTALRKHMADAPNDTRGAELEASIAGLTAERDGMLKQLSTANERIRRRDADIAKLQAALAKKLEAEAASAKKRGVFQADPNIKVPEKFAARVAKVKVWGGHIKDDNFHDFLPTADVEPRTGRPLAGYVDHLFGLVEWLGDLDAVVALAEVWIGMLTKFPLWAVKFIVLESSLLHDALVKSLWMLGNHQKMRPRIAEGYRVVMAYFERFEADRLADEKRANYVKPGPGVHGKALWHATKSDMLAYNFRALLWGKQSDKDAAAYLTDCLWDSLDFVTATDGTEIAIPAHGVQQRYKDQTGKTDHDFAHFVVYTSDSLADLETAALMGFSFATPRVVNALSRTPYLTYFTQGDPAKNQGQVAIDMAGGGRWEGKTGDRMVQFEDGSDTKGRWKIAPQGQNYNERGLQRGLALTSAYRHRDVPGLKQRLVEMDKRADNNRNGIQQVLLAWEMAEAGGRL